jgi:hypothetical protein
VITSPINGQVRQPSQEADIRVLPFDFAATEITVEATSEKGRGFFASMFGTGAVSVNMKKSAAFDFEKFAQQKGMVLA